MADNLPRYQKKIPAAQHSAALAHAPAKEADQQKASEPATKWRHKVSIYQDRDFTDRMRGAIIYTTSQEGPRTLSDFINGAIEAELERLEAKYNEGKPFPPVGPKGLPQGRPMGAE